MVVHLTEAVRLMVVPPTAVQLSGAVLRPVALLMVVYHTEAVHRTEGVHLMAEVPQMVVLLTAVRLTEVQTQEARTHMEVIPTAVPTLQAVMEEAVTKAPSILYSTH